VKLQNFEVKNRQIKQAFRQLANAHADRLRPRLNLSWSIWMFGTEPLEVTAERLARAGLRFVELTGNHFGDDLGYLVEEALAVLKDHGLQVSGISGMFTPDNDLSSPRWVHRQAALDYLRRETAFAAKVGATYIIVPPGGVGRPAKYDDAEVERSAATLRIAAPWFAKHHVRAAIEPIRAAETSLVHTVADAQAYLTQVNHPAIAYINGDTYHMQTEEAHVGEAILAAGSRLTNLHIADSNRRALGEGSLDLDTIIRALYLIGHNSADRFVSPEPLGPVADPYLAMQSRPDRDAADKMVVDTVRYFNEREEAVLGSLGHAGTPMEEQ
jgi:D-psicose/D-tagatose/L-ribulose 3-epimerase